MMTSMTAIYSGQFESVEMREWPSVLPENRYIILLYDNSSNNQQFIP